jgi:EmrB/QacA subfamily drug resistance transporter
MSNIGKPPCDEGVIRSGKAVVNARGKTSGPWILAAAILGSSMVFIDGTVTGVALPALQTNLHATATDVQWVVEAYALLLAALLLVGGSLADRYGRRLIFIIGVGVFAVASIWCGLATNINQLIIARAVQGVGGALLVPGSLAIISASFAEEQRGQAIGTWSGFTAITSAFGPVLGGWLIEHVSWRAVFFLNLPLAALVILISLRHVPESQTDEAKTKLDWLGAALATAGLGGIVYGLIESSRLGFTHRVVLFTLVAGGALLALFFVVEARARNPMLPLALFRSRNFTGANLLTLFLYTSLGGVFFFLPLNLIQVQGYTATAAGAATLPFVVLMFTLSRWSGGLVKRYGAKLPLIVGPLIAALGLALFLAAGVGGSYWKNFFPAIVVLGLGMAASVAPLTTTVMGSVARERAGVASGINNAVSRTAGLLAIAVFGIVMLQSFNSNLDERLNTLDVTPEARRSLDNERIKLAGAEIPDNLNSESKTALKRMIADSFVRGFRLVMMIAVALALLSALVSWIMIDGKNPRLVAG